MRPNEHRRKPRGLADLLLPFALIDDGVLLRAGWVVTDWLELSRTGYDVSPRR